MPPAQILPAFAYPAQEVRNDIETDISSLPAAADNKLALFWLHGVEQELQRLDPTGSSRDQDGDEIVVKDPAVQGK